MGGRDGEVGCGLRKNVFRPFGPQFDPKARGTLPWIHRCSLHYGGLFCWVLVFSRPENKSTRGDTPGNSWWGCAVRFSKSRPSQTKKCHFHTRFHTFQTSLLKSIPVFRPGIGRNYFIITKIRTPTKRFLEIHFEFAYYSSYLIRLELKGHSRGFFENHTLFSTKMDFSVQTKTAQKWYPLERHIVTWLIWVSTPPPPPPPEFNF